ncbi:MAG TPA: SgcJ/EcaC family oxidoreductase [Lacipirellulaceae bacterium]|jgi:uncharacterized protein (TIGR02246 family)|nr:SgcJ/EcaC family oxidoreductase [Lacipirellulaceae bacterium]
MKRLLFEVVAIFLVAFAHSNFAFAADNTGVEDAIRKSAKEFTDAYDRGDADTIAAQWTKDGEYSIGKDTVKGRDTIAKMYAEFFKVHTGSKMTVKINSIQVLAPTVAIEKGTAAVSESKNGPPSSSDYTAIHVKQPDGKWLMVSVTDSDSPTIEFEKDLKEVEWMVGDWKAVSAEAKISFSCQWMANKNFLRLEIKTQGDAAKYPSGLQVIGRNPQTGEIVSWFFGANGGFGTGIWHRDDKRWYIQTEGVAADGTPTTALNILYKADDNVVSWQSTRRSLGDAALPDVKEIAIERVKAAK